MAKQSGLFTSEKLLKEILPAAVQKAKNEGATSIFGQGWRLQSLDPLPTREDLDAICSDIPIYLLDEECHKALGNTILLKKAGIINEDGTAGKTTLRGDGAGGGLKLFDFLKKCVDGFRGGPSTFFPSF